MLQELRNLVGVAPSGFGCPLCASAPPGRGLEVDKGGGFAEPGISGQQELRQEPF